MMTNEYFQQKGRHLREVLKDAEERGDYYLEMDVKEALMKLRDEYYNDDDEQPSQQNTALGAE